MVFHIRVSKFLVEFYWCLLLKFLQGSTKMRYSLSHLQRICRSGSILLYANFPYTMVHGNISARYCIYSAYFVF